MSVNRKTIKRIKEEARKYFLDLDGCHDWTHVERVRNLSLHIGKKEGADLDVLEVVALLHDVGRKKEIKTRGRICHAQESAVIAGRILRKYGMDGEFFKNVIHCIKVHRFRNSSLPETVEAKVLFDADKLDSLGAVGIARVFLFAGRDGSGNLYTGNEKKLSKFKRDYSYTKEDSAMLEYEIKLKHIRNRLLTQTGRKIAAQRQEFMKRFFQRFWEEVKGEK